jgi:hypothetical protein
MADTQPKTEFEPVELKSDPRWHVRVKFPSGQQTYVNGFDTEAQARDWIARDATAWLQRQCESGKYR